jgi:hypothetical protein
MRKALQEELSKFGSGDGKNLTNQKYGQMIKYPLPGTGGER